MKRISFAEWVVSGHQVLKKCSLLSVLGPSEYLNKKFVTLGGPFITAIGDFITTFFSCAVRLCIVMCWFSMEEV